MYAYAKCTDKINDFHWNGSREKNAKSIHMPQIQQISNSNDNFPKNTHEMPHWIDINAIASCFMHVI